MPTVEEPSFGMGERLRGERHVLVAAALDKFLLRRFRSKRHHHARLEYLRGMHTIRH